MCLPSSHTRPQVLVEPGFGEDVRLQPAASPPSLPSPSSPPRTKHPSYVEPGSRSPRKQRVRHASEPSASGERICASLYFSSPIPNFSMDTWICLHFRLANVKCLQILGLKIHNSKRFDFGMFSSAVLPPLQTSTTLYHLLLLPTTNTNNGGNPLWSLATLPCLQFQRHHPQLTWRHTAVCTWSTFWAPLSLVGSSCIMSFRSEFIHSVCIHIQWDVKS